MIKATMIIFLLIYNPLFAQNDINKTKIKLDKLNKIKKELGLIPKENVKKELVKPKIKTNKALSKDKQKEIEKIRKELGIETPSKKETKLEKIRRELGIEYEIPKKKDKLIDKIENIKKKLDIDIDLDFNLNKTIRKLEKSLNLNKKKKSSWEIPDIFDFGNTKKEKTILGLSILQDVKDSTSTLYKSAKYSGESAELMSGAVYYNAKLYNTMFDIFDKSPLNIFEDKEKKSSSLFGIFD